ncbi:Spc97 / Spc98 family protein [Theileria parva strain Muguga]|uniref:Gamma tubulin complex component protein N-terminal domain-containing protein n=1 Tax=Theileria parva TaxID=5875 RepID=Q4N9G2_THEPA|nr:Spc97 / Spc98 family protein [Theileria parva strain Muguga]EAN33396.1 Spc97 / Spc98 family protein [Theileria parva strain Muguga]|eukprot:XP_765679.1 hypothetical protein [Theileria parva strain Muguga]
MYDSSESLAKEFLKLIEYLSNNSRSAYNGISISKIPDFSAEIPNQTQIASKLEAELVTLLDEFDISEPLNFNLYDVLRDYDRYFNSKNKIPFEYVNEIVMSVTLGSKDFSSVLQLLFLLRDKACFLDGQFTNNPLPDVPSNDFQINKEKSEELMLDEFLSSQLRQLYYSPLILESDTAFTPTNINLPSYNNNQTVDNKRSDTNVLDDSNIPSDKNDLSYVVNGTEMSESDSPYSLVSVDDNVLAEGDLVLDMLYLLKGVDGKYFKRMRTYYSLVNPTLKISSDFKFVISKIIFVADLYNTVKLYLNQLNSSNPTNSHSLQSQYNLKNSNNLQKLYNNLSGIKNADPILNCLLQAIVEELTGYAKLLDLLLLNFGDYLTLLQLYSLLHKPYRKIRIIYSLVTCDHVSPNALYRLTFTGNYEHRGLYLRLLKKSLVPFFEVIFRWLYSGELSSVASNMGFFINFSDGCFTFDSSKLFHFFPKTLAEDIFEKGLLFNQLKRLKKSNLPTPTLNSFLQLLNLQSALSQLQNNATHTNGNTNTTSVNTVNTVDEVKDNEEWSLEYTLTTLKNIVSGLRYSEDIASTLIKDYQLLDFINNSLLYSIIPNPCPKKDYTSNYTNNILNKAMDSSKLVEGLGNLRDNLELIRSFPYSLLFDDSYDFINSLMSLSSLFNAAVDSLNRIFLDYIWFYRLSTGILDLSSFFNKINFYRSEMISFMFSVQPFHDVKFHFNIFKEDVQRSKDLSNLRDSLSKFKKNIKSHLFPSLTDCFKNILDFSSSISRIFTSLNKIQSTSNCTSGINGANNFRNYLDKLMDDMDPVSVVKYIEDQLMDESISSCCLQYGLDFRKNVTKLSRGPLALPLMDFNNYYIINKCN